MRYKGTTKMGNNDIKQQANIKNPQDIIPYTQQPNLFKSFS